MQRPQGKFPHAWDFLQGLLLCQELGISVEQFVSELLGSREE